ncbi:MAG: ROK family protein [Verrucomicrobia bacterium]|nr:ROK family protein [Verrucomicrobiota bacterium]
MTPPYLLGLDLGGSSVKAVAVTPNGETLRRFHATFDPDRPGAFADAARDLHQRAVRELAHPPARCGVSAPGLAARDARSIAFMPGRLAGLEGLDWTHFLASDTPVPVLNDAQAALLGEVWLGAARGAANAILLTLGTGVGGAAMVDGHLLRGAIGRAGHLGHITLDRNGPPDICGTPGSLEWAVGNYRIRERTDGRFDTTHELVAAHLAGDPFATRVWLDLLQALACGIASLINVLDPEVVIVGGGIAQAGSALFEPLGQFLEPIEWRPGGHRVRMAPAGLGDLAGAYGAAWNAHRSPL